MDHHSHHEHMIADFSRRFWICLALTVPVLLFSTMIQSWLGFEIEFAGREYVAAGLSTFIFFYGGWPFLTGLFSELKKGSPGMMTLIGIAITVAWIYSMAVVLGLDGKIFFWELVTLIDVMLLGHWMEMRSILGASKALKKLAELMPSNAHKIEGDEIREVRISELHKGDKVLIKPGEKIPADGKIYEGESEIDESAMTGESRPVEKKEGDEVIGGSVNGDGSFRIEVSSAGEDSYLRKVIRLVESAQATKSKTQHLADRAAKWLTYIALTVGILTFVAWYWMESQGLDFALERMVTVMVITCPHALGLAIPLVVAISTSISAKNGLLIRNRTAFENARKIDAIIFDKTGTLTEGAFSVEQINSYNNEFDEDKLLATAAAIEQNSEHPLAKGIVKEAKERSVEIPELKDFKMTQGKGVQGTVGGTEYVIASPAHLRESNIEIPGRENDEETQLDTTVYMLRKDELLGSFVLRDKVRTESKAAIDKLRSSGIEVYMATGDNKKAAKLVSDELGLDGYYAEVLPDEKAELVKKLQKDGKFVAMTGDGVNDAPALATADIGIAVGSGTAVAAETADIILTESSPADIENLISFGRATYRKMIQNLFWATGYNVIAIPLAAGVLFYQGIVVNPAIGAAVMSASTIIAAVNAQLLRFSIKN